MATIRDLASGNLAALQAYLQPFQHLTPELYRLHAEVFRHKNDSYSSMFGDVVAEIRCSVVEWCDSQEVQA